MIDAADPRASLGEVFRDLLERHPNALVGAAPIDGMFIPLPAGVPGRPLEVTVRAATLMVADDDRVPLTNAWYQAVDDGYAAIEVGLVDSGRRGTFHLIDVRAEYGCFVQMLVPDGGGDWQPSPRLTAPPQEPPKIIRMHKGVGSKVEWVDPRVEQMLGWTADDMVGRRSIEFIHEDHHDGAVESWLDMLTAEGATTRHKVRHSTKDGGWKWLEVSNRNLLDDEGYVDCEMVDITEEVEAQVAVRAREQLLRQLAAALPVGVLHLDVDGHVRYTNDRYREIVGLDPARHHEGFELVLGGIDDPAIVRDAVARGEPVDIELDVPRSSDGDLRHCTLAIRPLTDEDGAATGAVVCLTDVTESVRLREELARRALTDTLTGALNRPGILAVLERALLSAEADQLAVVFVDLDGFKGINDRHGHHVGDQVLQHVGAMLHSSIRAGDAVGRIGGDEFLLVCHDVTTDEAAYSIARRAEAVVATPVEIDGEWHSIGASIGVHRVPDPHGRALDEIVAAADATMYATKLRRRQAAADPAPVTSG